MSSALMGTGVGSFLSRLLVEAFRAFLSFSVVVVTRF